MQRCLKMNGGPLASSPIYTEIWGCHVMFVDNVRATPSDGAIPRLSPFIPDQKSMIEVQNCTHRT
jgi:hypothetical protein